MSPRPIKTAVLLLAALPAIARADAPTPLMFGMGAHLLIGNALIGALEGRLIARVFGGDRRKTVGVMVLANYISMLPGFLGINSLAQVLSGGEPLYHAWRVFWGGFAVAFLATAVLEWPFCVWALPTGPRRALRGVQASLVAQAASYALLVPFYLAFTAIRFDGVTFDPALTFAKGARAWVYYIGDDGSVNRARPDGSSRSLVTGPAANGTDSRLFSLRTSSGALPGLWLWEGSDTPKMVLETLPGKASFEIFKDLGDPTLWSPDGSMTSSLWGALAATNCSDLRPPGEGRWELWCPGYRPMSFPLAARKTHDGPWERGVMVHGPFGMLDASAISILPGNLVVSQFGRQIVILDLDGGRLGTLASGHGPVVVLDGEP